MVQKETGSIKMKAVSRRMIKEEFMHIKPIINKTKNPSGGLKPLGISSIKIGDSNV
jgi:hypothetical protein